jgi:hypothetical protein
LLRFAAGLTVIRLDDKTEILTIDLRNKLWIGQATVVGIPVPDATVRQVLADDVGVINLLPLPADQNATTPDTIKDIDLRLIDDIAAGPGRECRAADLRWWSCRQSRGFRSELPVAGW